jgi:DNA-binding response OmpR family regulator
MTETRFTKMEARVLDLLQRNAGQIVTRTFFLENVWGYKSGVKSRTLDVHISKLRAKLAIDPNLRIRAVVGLGYRLERGQPIQSFPAEDSSNGRRKFAGVASMLGQARKLRCG